MLFTYGVLMCLFNTTHPNKCYHSINTSHLPPPLPLSWSLSVRHVSCQTDGFESLLSNFVFFSEVLLINASTLPL